MTLSSAIAVLALFGTASPVVAEFRVGFAAADITPPVGWRRAGNYTELISTGDRNIFRPAGPVDTDFPFLLARRVGQASSLTVHGASVPLVAGGRMPPEPADKMSAPHGAALGSLAVRSAFVMAPVTPISYVEQDSAKNQLKQ